jgi:hypothetical protein
MAMKCALPADLAHGSSEQWTKRKLAVLIDSWNASPRVGERCGVGTDSRIVSRHGERMQIKRADSVIAKYSVRDALVRYSRRCRSMPDPNYVMEMEEGRQGGHCGILCLQTRRQSTRKARIHVSLIRDLSCRQNDIRNNFHPDLLPFGRHRSKRDADLIN